MHRDEKQLAGGNIKVWRQDAKEVVIHHQAGLTIGMNDLEEIELFQWLQNDLNKRGLLPEKLPCAHLIEDHIPCNAPASHRCMICGFWYCDAHFDSNFGLCEADSDVRAAEMQG